MEEVMYELKNPFEYAFKGESRNASFITLRKPNMKCHDQASDLAQAILRIMRGYQEDKDQGDQGEQEEESDGVIDPSSLAALLTANKDVPVKGVWSAAKSLFSAGVAQVDGEQKLTLPLIEKMDIEDFENLTGEYVINFIIA